MNRTKTLGLLALAALLAITTGIGVVKSRGRAGAQEDDSSSPTDPGPTASVTGKAHQLSSPSGEAAPAPSSPEARKASGHSMQTSKVRSQVRTWIELLERGQSDQAKVLEDSIRKSGTVAKNVLGDVLQSGQVSESSRPTVRSTYESIP